MCLNEPMLVFDKVRMFIFVKGGVTVILSGMWRVIRDLCLTQSAR